MGRAATTIAKVEEFLRAALAEPDLAKRGHLIGKAAYWNRVAEKEGAPPPGNSGRWTGYSRAR